MDRTEHLNKMVNEEEKRIQRLAAEAEEELPTHSRQATKMTREEEKQNYLQTKYTPGGFGAQLKEWKAQFGLVRAVDYLLDWSRDNE